MTRAFYVLALAAFIAAIVGGQPHPRADAQSAALAPATAQPGTGTGTETGLYAPPLAGPRASVSGTITGDQSGPTGYYVAIFDSHGDAKYMHGTTDARGRYAFAIPAAAAAFMVFRHFDASGRPDEGARCMVSSDPAAVVSATRAANVARAGSPAIVRGNAALQRGTPVTLQTRGTDAATSQMLIDGSPNSVITLAASDRSVVGQLRPDAPLGRHSLSVQSRGKRSAPVPVDLIDATLTAGGSHETGGIQTAVLSITGLSPNERAIANFEVSGSAELASGGNQVSVPVVDNRATVEVRGTRAGQAIIRWNLRVDIPPVWTEQVAEATPTPYPYYTTSRPSPEPTPRPTATPTRKPGNDRTTGRDREVTPPPTNVRTPHPHTTTNPTPTPPPPTPTPYPTSTVSPTPSPPPCSYEMADGVFEPTQGVWQDDPFFPNMAGKQLTRLHDLDPIPHFYAELDMIEGRDTVLFGVNHYMDQGTRVDINSRHSISLTFRTNCTKTKPARIAFVLKQRGSSRLILMSQVFNIPIEAPRNADGQMKPFTVTMPVRDGIPATPFLIDDGGYDIDAELVTLSGDHTGLEVIVTGDTVVTYAPTLHFVPMRLFFSSPPPPAFPTGPGTPTGTLISMTEALRAESASMIPDYYPIVPFSLPTIRERLWLVSWQAIKNDDWWDATKFVTGYVLSGFDQDDADIFTNLAVVDRFKTGISNAQGFAGFINGANRMVIVMSGIDYDTVMGSSKIASFNLGNKAVLMRAGVTSDDVGHEVAHSIPPPNWNPDPECNFPYHNAGVTNVMPDPYGSGTTANGYAAGERLRLNGARHRVFTDGTIHIMAGSIAAAKKRVYKYTTQCTYWHLIKELQQPPDPDVYLVRGVIARSPSGKYAAVLGPTYTLAGPVDLKQNARGAWHITVADARGSTLADYAFDVSWTDENGQPRSAAPFMYRIPQQAGAAAIVLSGGGRRLTVRLSSAPPEVKILAPIGRSKPGTDGTITARWQANVQQGYAATSSLFLSEDGGKTYQSELIESLAKSAVIHVNPRKHRHRLKIIVSDYSRSTQAVRDFTTP